MSSEAHEMVGLPVPDVEQLLEPADPSRPAWCQFDHAWYATAYPDTRDDAGVSFAALRDHYVSHGRKQGRSPNMFFDEQWYRQRYPDVAAMLHAGEIGSAYEHYCHAGYRDRSPHWLFDDATYAAFSPDLHDQVLNQFACLNRYDHYLKAGDRERRVAHLLFDPERYRASILQTTEDADDVDAIGPYAHFLKAIRRGDFDPPTSRYFDRDWYVRSYDAVRTVLDNRGYLCALHHYLSNPTPAAFDPCPDFSETFYRATVAQAETALRAGTMRSGYEHFLKIGVFAAHAPAPHIDLRRYLAASPQARTDLHEHRCRDAFAHLLRFGGTQLGPLAQPVGSGAVDLYGHHAPSCGWVFAGWLNRANARPEGAADVKAVFTKGAVSGTAVIAWHEREDAGPDTTGFILHLQSEAGGMGDLVSLRIISDSAAWQLQPADRGRKLHDQELASGLQPLLACADAIPDACKLALLQARTRFDGTNTLGQLRERVLLEIDETILCPPDGLVLSGWAMMPPESVAAIRLHSGERTTDLDLAACIRTGRPDVLAEFNAKHGCIDAQCGFLAFLPGAHVPGAVSYLEVQTVGGERAFRGLPEPRLRGLEAIRFILERFEVRYDEVAPAFDRVAGPAVAALNRARLAEPTQAAEIAFGTQAANPVLSVIIPLHGRIDFMEYQIALFSSHAPSIAVEFLYVLDDPERRREAEHLALSVFRRFAIPFRLLALSRNVGYAPANNIGLSHARGDYVCFLNSDVFPGTDDWMERLVARLRSHHDLGAVGPLLLFEDGAVQHQGMSYEPLQELGGWLFPVHERKGWRPEASRDLSRCAAITGACLVMRRELARELGGFDEAFVIGDFEDSDLCLKLGQRGLGCAVDPQVHLYHLERQSQAGSEQRWRMNLTLHNAWVHERRWRGKMPSPVAGSQSLPAELGSPARTSRARSRRPEVAGVASAKAQ
jgi:O-antigen biosynthesis protein